ncbi:MAG: aminodeoxychorismate synthase [Cyanobacterium sp. T60_A2020_053]|nr:aminodeoxychorismate synthase [Cyanobacterium sp. T60_A2020_053]
MNSLIIDNYDSFTYNIYQLLAQVNNQLPTIITNNQWSWEEIRAKNFQQIIISPGPGNPERIEDFGVCREILINSNIPILGICLGHQGIGYYNQAPVTLAPQPMHGRMSKIYHHNHDLFKDIPSGFSVVRYHSLIIEKVSPQLECIATTKDKLIMAIAHKNKPFWGVQFHPESICSQYGYQLLKNFQNLTKNFWEKQLSINLSDFKKKQPSINLPHFKEEIKGVKSRQLHQLYTKKLDIWQDTEIVFKEIYGNSEYSFWLDSSMVAKGLSRFSFMGDSQGENSFTLDYNVNDNQLKIIKNKIIQNINENIFTYLKEYLTNNYVHNNSDLPFNFNTGFVGYFGYELKSLCGYDNIHQSKLPDSFLIKSDRLIAFDHQEQKTYLLYYGKKSKENLANQWFNEIILKLENISKKNNYFKIKNKLVNENKTGFTRNKEHYLKDIKICFEKIKQGESYEICLTNQINLPPMENTFKYYQILRRQNPAPFSAYLKLGDMTIISSSPERFLQLDQNKWLESKPIKGTTKRSQNKQEDQQLKKQLTLSEKERAENLMIVDLLRNDLGKICEIGTVSVPKLMAIESYETLHQMVSTVKGKLNDDLGSIDAILATFPGGSMTGAPKKRTLEIIDQLETEARGIYSGSIGFLGLNGTLDLNIVIRTAVITPEKTTIGVGGAITALSDDIAEWEEIKLKGRALLQAYFTAILNDS